MKESELIESLRLKVMVVNLRDRLKEAEDDLAVANKLLDYYRPFEELALKLKETYGV